MWHQVSCDFTSLYVKMFLEYPLHWLHRIFWQERAINLVVGFLTALIVFITLISAFVFHETTPRGVNIFFGIVIVLICASHLTVVSQLWCTSHLTLVTQLWCMVSPYTGNSALVHGVTLHWYVRSGARWCHTQSSLPVRLLIRDLQMCDPCRS